MSPIRRNHRVLLASLVGTTVEFYDFYIYATAAALVFGPLFFPSESPSAQLLFSLMSFGLAFVARPVGAIVFGHFGDKLGRKSTLVVSLMLMGISTLLIGFLPTYAMVGWPAAALLCLCRLGQGFALGGEWGGASLLAVENAPPGWVGRFSSAPQFGAPLGFMAANGLFLVLGFALSEADFNAWGWRIPFILSAVLVGVGLWVRLKVTETSAFAAAAVEEDHQPGVPIGVLLRHHWRAAIGTIAGVIAIFAIFYLGTTFTLGHMTTTRGFAREDVLLIQLVANLFLAMGIGMAAWWADKTSPRRVLIIGSIATVVAGFAFGPVLASGGLGALFMLLAVQMTVAGMVYGPLGAWMSAAFPVRVRYTGISIGFNCGGVIGGALAPLGAQALAAEGHIALSGLILSAAGIVTLVGLVLLRADRHAGAPVAVAA
ncbi:MAG: MFS transporter [Alteraurantiacibacter sp.]